MPETKKTDRPEDRLFIRFLAGVNYLFSRVYHRLTVLKPVELPHDGPAILVCNHISSIDPSLLQSACPYRMITWMVAKEYTEKKGFGWLYKTLGAIPVERTGKDSGALRGALRQLTAGRVLGIFPEGKISTTGELLDFQTGIALIAIRSKVPVYPAYLDGTQRNKEMKQAFFQRARSVITFGQPVEFNREETSRENLEAATAAIKLAVESLRQEIIASGKLAVISK